MEENKQLPVMLDVVNDARMNLEKIAQVLVKVEQGLTTGEILALRPELEGLAYSAAIILMNAEIISEESKGGE